MQTDLRYIILANPKKPSPNRITKVMGNFCNLTDSQEIPIDDGFIDYLILNDVHRAYEWASRLLDAGSTHINIGLSGDYAENLGWIDRYPIPGMDFTNNLDAFKRVLDFCLNRNLTPIVHLAADGQEYDPVGWTYGWDWGMKNLPMILTKLSDYHLECLWNTGWDGCFPDWTPDQTIQFLRMLKLVLRAGSKIATEFSGPGSVGYCHMGNGAGDWTPDKLGMLDAFFIELNSYPPNEEGVSETATRLLGPDAQNCPTSPFYLQTHVDICFFETCAYQYIRKQISDKDARIAASVGEYYGFKYFGNGLPL